MEEAKMVPTTDEVPEDPSERVCKITSQIRPLTHNVSTGFYTPRNRATRSTALKAPTLALHR